MDAVPKRGSLRTKSGQNTRRPEARSSNSQQVRLLEKMPWTNTITAPDDRRVYQKLLGRPVGIGSDVGVSSSDSFGVTTGPPFSSGRDRYQRSVRPICSPSTRPMTDP